MAMKKGACLGLTNGGGRSGSSEDFKQKFEQRSGVCSVCARSV